MKNTLTIFIFLFIGASLISSCTTTNLLYDDISEDDLTREEEKLFKFDSDYQYTIRKDDKITISVWEQSELSVGSTYGIYNSNEVYGKWLMVDVNGNIEVPRTGTLNVEHLTIPELKVLIKDSLSELLVNPIVDVKILNREISFLGEFRDPATVSIDKERNYLLDLVAQVGGFEFYANLKEIKVLRQVREDTQVINLDLSKNGDFKYKNIPLYPGDIVIAPSKNFKAFDRRLSNIIPFTSAITAAAIFLK